MIDERLCDEVFMRGYFVMNDDENKMKQIRLVDYRCSRVERPLVGESGLRARRAESCAR